MLGKSSPYPCIPVLPFSPPFSPKIIEYHFLPNTTCSPHVFLEVQNLSVCLQLSLVTIHSKGVRICGFYFIADQQALVRTQSWFLTAETQSTRSTTW